MKIRTASALAILALLAAPALAQTPGARPGVAWTPFVDAQLRVRGEQYHRAPDSQQNPVELSITQRLNSEVAIRNELADRTDAANDAQAAEARADYRAERTDYREAVADTVAENERRQIDAEINAQSRAEFNAEQQSRYDKAMTDWRATVRACEAGDTARCRASQQRPALSDY